MPLGVRSLIGIAGSINQEIKAMAKQINSGVQDPETFAKILRQIAVTSVTAA